MNCKLLVVILISVNCAVLLGEQSARAQDFKPVNNWRFIPLQNEIWTKFTTHLKKSEYGDAAELIGSMTNKDETSIAEKNLAIAELCLSLGYKACSSVYYTEVVRKFPGTSAQQAAWVKLEQLASENLIDEEEIQRLINLANFSEIPDGLQSFMAYYVTMDNLQKGLEDWAKKSQAGIQEGSFWSYKMEFLNILNELNSGKINLTAAIDRLASLEFKAQKYKVFTVNLALQRARLLYEAKRMNEAEEIYSSLSFPGRNFGRALFERAWIRYFARDYSVTLGMLESLKSPYFSVAINPEQYVLAMLSYRDLCHYPSVKSVMTEFGQRFGETIEYIKTNKPLSGNNDLMWMALQKADLQKLADFISAIKSDALALQNQATLPASLKVIVQRRLNLVGQDLRTRQGRILEVQLKKEAENLLQVNEQVKLIDYISSLDEFRLKKTFEQRAYKSENVEHLAIDKLYWPVMGEYWFEEFNHYQVLINDRCQSGGAQ